MATQSISATVSFNRLQNVVGHVTVLNRDGVVDTTTPLTISSDNPAIATIAIDGTDNRKVTLSGVSPGPTVLHVTCDLGANGGAQQLNITCSVADVDLSTISGVFDPPVLR